MGKITIKLQNKHGETQRVFEIKDDKLSDDQLASMFVAEFIDKMPKDCEVTVRKIEKESL
jgi:hypothetical protein